MAAPGALAQHAVEQAVLSVAKRLEDQLDSQLHKLDNLKDDDLERIRQKRIDEMRRQQDQAREWAARGHGVYTELLDEKSFFKEVKGEERVVAHFYRENWPCKVRRTEGARTRARARRRGRSLAANAPALTFAPRCRAPPAPATPAPTARARRAAKHCNQVLGKHLQILARKHLEPRLAPPTTTR